uniref:Putative RdRp n=1 Tax=Monilinia benyvirus C TaxID=2592780 RepID=A0A7G3KJ11_9VIRU|nr:putative RdRp [Monilinia benyvirus C]
MLSLIQEYVGCRVRCEGKKTLSTDHAPMMVARDLARAQFERVASPHHCGVRSLFIGSTDTEIKSYGANAANTFSVHGTESKDVGRVIASMADRAAKRVQSAHNDAFVADVVKTLQVSVKGFKKLSALANKGAMREGSVVRGIPSGEAYGRIIGLDMLYEVKGKELCDIYQTTGAYDGFFTLFIPNEFIDPTVCESEFYSLTRHFPWDDGVQLACHLQGPIITFLETVFPGRLAADWAAYLCASLTHLGPQFLSDMGSRIFNDAHPVMLLAATIFDVAKVKMFMPLVTGLVDVILDCVRRISVTYKDGYSNGYHHKESTWRSWAVNRRFTNGVVTIDMEVIGRHGESYLLRGTRSNGLQVLAHQTTIAPQFQSIEILDFTKSWVKSTNWTSGALGENVEWTKVRYVEYQKLLDWACAEPFERLTLGMIKMAVNRLRAGLSINSTEIVPAWKTPAHMLTNLCLVVYIEAARNSNLFAEIAESKEYLAGYETNIKWLGKKIMTVGLILATGGLCIPALYLVNWFVKTSANVNVVKDRHVAPVVLEKSKPVGFSIDAVTVPIAVNTVVDRQLDCEVCQEFQDGMYGKQKVICDNQGNGKAVTLRLDAGAVNKLFDDLSDAKAFHQQANAMTVVKKINAAKDVVETWRGAGQKVELKLSFMSGPPGSGKSVYARELAEKRRKAGKSVLVVGPFNKLAGDYCDATMLNGEKRSFIYETLYHALGQRNSGVVIADEVGAVDMPLLFLICFLVGANELVMIGDKGQTLLQEKEGDAAATSSRIPWSDIPCHSLYYIFRCKNPLIAKILNAKFGYKVASPYTDYQPIAFRKDGDEPNLSYYKLKDDDGVPVPEDYASRAKFSFTHESATVWGAQSEREKAMHSVRAAQGTTVNHAEVALCDRDTSLVRTHGFLVVAISRQRGDLGFKVVDINDPVVTEVRGALGLCGDGYQQLVDAPWPEVPPKEKRSSRMTALDERVFSLLDEKVEFLSDNDDELTLVTHHARFITKIQENEERIASSDAVRQPVKVVFNDCLLTAYGKTISKNAKANLEAKWYEVLSGKLESLLVAKRIARSDKGEYSVVGDGDDKSGKLHVDLFDFIEMVKSVRLGIVVIMGGAYYCYGECDHKEVGVTTGGIFVKNRHAKPITETWRLTAIVKPAGSAGWSFRDAGKEKDFEDDESRLLFSKYKSPSGSYVLDEVLPGNVREPMLPSHGMTYGYDSHRLAHEIDGTKAFEFTGATCWSDYGTVQGVTCDIAKGTRINIDGFHFDRTSAGAAVAPRKQPFRVLTNGMCLHQTRDPVETLRSASRYLDASNKDTKFSIEGRNLADKVANEFFDENFRDGVTLDEAEIRTIERAALSDAQARKYDKKVRGEAASFKPLLGLTFFSKAQEKMKLDPFKRGQGIGVPNMRFAAPFMSGWRLNNLLIKKSARGHLFYDNLRPTEEYLVDVSQALQTTVSPKFSVSAKVDHKEFDRKQGWWTRRVERTFFTRLGINPAWIDDYQQCRETTIGTAFGLFRGWFVGKFSGFWDTLPGNTVVGGAIGDFVVRGAGRKVVCIKGDDLFKAQSALKIREEERKDVQRFSGMQIEVQVDEAIEFCGMIGSSKGLCPDVFRLGLKAMAKRFRNYKAFTEWQISARDTMKMVERFGLSNCIGVTAAVKGYNVDQVEASLGVLNSMSHWSLAQFEESMGHGEEKRARLPGANGEMFIKL